MIEELLNFGLSQCYYGPRKNEMFRSQKNKNNNRRTLSVGSFSTEQVFNFAYVEWAYQKE